jgi:N6-adenosine-specific RNA methylase IME4
VSGKYQTIVADPPWEHPDSGKRTQPTKGGTWGGKWVGHGSKVPYERMTLEEIKALPVPELAARDSHLYLWTTNGFLRDAFTVLDAWGFKFSTVLTWCKAPMGLGLGGAFSITTEFVLHARRGKLAPLQRLDTTWWQFKRPHNQNGGPAHSAKPEAFLDYVELVSPEPRVELFARRARFGWDYWGDQSLGTVEMPEPKPEFVAATEISGGGLHSDDRG